MTSCVYPGSFDPLTNGHLDIIERACAIFPKVYVAVLNNTQKKYMFDQKTRVEMAKAATRQWDCVEVVSSDGLLVELLKKLDTRVVLRGLRSNADLEMEQQLAAVNNLLLDGVETFVLLSRPHTQYISSSLIRELIIYKADIKKYIPEEIYGIITGGTHYENP